MPFESFVSAMMSKYYFTYLTGQNQCLLNISLAAIVLLRTESENKIIYPPDTSIVE
jgi:hypothetical protein